MSHRVLQLQPPFSYRQINRLLRLLLAQLFELFRPHLRPMPLMLRLLQTGQQPMRRALSIQQVLRLYRSLRLVPPELHVVHRASLIPMQNLCLRVLPLPLNLLPILVPWVDLPRGL